MEAGEDGGLGGQRDQHMELSVAEYIEPSVDRHAGQSEDERRGQSTLLRGAGNTPMIGCEGGYNGDTSGQWNDVDTSESSITSIGLACSPRGESVKREAEGPAPSPSILNIVEKRDLRRRGRKRFSLDTRERTHRFTSSPISVVVDDRGASPVRHRRPILCITLVC